MKISCGTDIIEIERIKESIENIGESFLNKIYIYFHPIFFYNIIRLNKK